MGAGAIALLVGALAASAAAAQSDEASSLPTVIELYCTSCHTVGGVGGREAGAGPMPPDLALLGQVFGHPLPKTRLLHRIAPPPGAPRTLFACGDHILDDMENERFTFHFRRGTVLEILFHLDGLQVAARPGAER